MQRSAHLIEQVEYATAYRVYQYTRARLLSMTEISYSGPSVCVIDLILTKVNPAFEWK